MRLAETAAITRLILESQIVFDQACVAGYHALNSEVDPAQILKLLDQKGHVCCLPVTCFGTRVLQFQQYAQDQELGQDIRGIPAPVASAEHIPDIILVPMLGFDKRGYRLGQGGGHYDSTLDALRPEHQVIAIGLAFDCQEVPELPVEIHDQPMDYIVTATRILSFK